MEIIADLEVHSKYSRAVSSSMNIGIIAEWAYKKGINLVGTGDFTHPLWLRELEANLEESGQGVYRLKTREKEQRVNFLLTSEVSCIYSDKGKGKRVHIMVFFPEFKDVRKFNSELLKTNANLFSDGRPIINLSLYQVASLALSVNPKALIIPAHVWTPWFGFYGSESGYDSLKEAFAELEKEIPAVETGLSSDPSMNWRIEELNSKRIVSFGDAHSPQKLGREATVFEISNLSYDAVRKALRGEEPEKISYTIEFYPEEGKYHYTGHRNCKVVYSPEAVRGKGLICPVCGKKLTFGVMSRVEALAGSSIETFSEKDEFGVRWIKAKGKVLENKRPYVMLVPLLEIIAEAVNLGVESQKVIGLYELLINHFGSEFSVLLKTHLEDIEKVGGSRLREAVQKVRSGDIVIKPGYDGVFGTVKIWEEKEKYMNKKLEVNQDSLF